MPKASIKKNTDPFTAENYIRLALYVGLWSSVFSKTKSQLVDDAAKSALRFCVDRQIRAHDAPDEGG